MSKEFTYDAFISYRHLPLDGAVAERLQKLLEQYRPPKGIKCKSGRKHLRVFRDTTELPTSGSLDTALQRALLDSEYLIVVLSEETIHSKWCMAEIREFKAAHDGSVSHILPVLVSGDPAVSIPAELRSGTVAVVNADGSVTLERNRVVEPLCADARGEDTGASLKKLKTEFLRLAAPMLGCGYDDLYRRHVRRQRRILLSLTAFFAALTITFGWLAYLINRTEKRYEKNLINTYTQQGSSGILQAKNQEAAAYFTNALAIDRDASAAKAGMLLMLQQSRWPGLTNERDGALPDRAFPDGRSFLAQDDTLEILDAEGKLISRIPRPFDMNPAVDAESVSYFADSTPVVACAGDTAFVRHGDYVYLYDIRVPEAVLKTRLDLADFFPEQAADSMLSGYGSVWPSPDGSLLALDSGAFSAVISLKDRVIETKLTNYFYELNDVVFSHDLERYAFVFGNYSGVGIGNPGGFLQVFNRSNELVFETEINSDIAFRGAAFSPEDSLLIAWGSGTLQFFDLESGTEYAEPLHCQSLASAAFVGEKIVVDMGKGKLYDCAFSAFSLKEDAVEEEADASLPEKNDNTRDRIELGDHLYVSRKPSRVQLLDEAGQTLSECRIEDHFINRMCVDQKNRLIYVWYRGADRIFRIPYDPSRKTLGPLSELDTRGFEITDARETGLGLLAVTGNGSLLFYGNTDDVRPRSMKLGKDGVVRELAVNDNGLAALIISDAEAANGLNNYQFDQYFGVELWDLTMAVRLAEFEAGNKTPLRSIRITEQGRLSYDKGEEKVIWRVDAPAPDKKTLSAVQKLSCLELDENQAVRLKAPFIEPVELGNWGALLQVEQYSAIKEEKPSLSAEESLIAEADKIRKDGGAEAWLSWYDALWDKIADGEQDLSFSQITALFRDYCTIVRNEPALTDRIEHGITVYQPLVFEQLKSDDYASLSFDLQMAQMLVLTGAYDGLMAAYWDRCADDALVRYRESGESDLLEYCAVFENRMLSATVRGMGADAFAEACRDIGTDYVDVLFSQTGLGTCYLLAQEKPVEAAEAFDGYVELLLSIDPRETLDSLFNDIMMVMFEACFLERANGMDIKIMDSFLEHTSYLFGYELKKQSVLERQFGLQPGDLVVAVNGHSFGCLQHMERLKRLYPDAALTYVRSGKAHTTEQIAAWDLAGEFTVLAKP